MSVNSDICTALSNLLKTVLISNGYATDAGLHVFNKLEYQTQEPQKPCIIWYDNDLTSGFGGDTPPCLGEENHFLQVNVEGFIADDESGSQGNLLMFDLLRCIKSDRYLGGLTEGFEGDFSAKSSVAESDEGFVGFVQVSFIIFYVTPYGVE